MDLDGICEQIELVTSSTGGPSIDPELIIWTLIIGYCMGIRPGRLLCKVFHFNLAYSSNYLINLDQSV